MFFVVSAHTTVIPAPVPCAAFPPQPPPADTGRGPMPAHRLSEIRTLSRNRRRFLWRSGDVGEVEESKVALIGPDRLARMVFDAGLTS
jgi:hypothetical protein